MWVLYQSYRYHMVHVVSVSGLCVTCLRGFHDVPQIMGNKIHIHKAHPSAYAAQLESLRTYARASVDVLARWPYPFTPDAACALGAPGRAVALSQGNRYTGTGGCLECHWCACLRKLPWTSLGAGLSLTLHPQRRLTLCPAGAPQPSGCLVTGEPVHRYR